MMAHDARRRRPRRVTTSAGHASRADRHLEEAMAPDEKLDLEAAERLEEAQDR